MKVEAPSYLPAVSEPFTSDQGSVTCDFKLKRGNASTGSVRNADGKPVGGAIITLVELGQTLMIVNGKTFESRNEIIRSDDAGAFTLPPNDSLSRCRLAVLHADGYAELPLNDIDAGKIEVTLTPWGILNGRAWIGDKPAAGTSISLYQQPQSSDDRRVFWHYTVQSDADGNFTFDRAPAGALQVAIMINVGQNMWAPSGAEIQP